MNLRYSPALALPLLLWAAAPSYKPSGSDWLEWRGPQRDGTSLEKNLPTAWSPAGENLLWRIPVGGRSAPVVAGNHVYLQNYTGAKETLQERVMCVDADTGKTLWEYAFNMFLSDVPPHRIGWASPAVDPATGNVFVLGGGGTFLALSPDGKLLWSRPLGEDFGLVTTHGGRTVSPVIDGDLVIISGITSAWGDSARAAQRFMGFNKVNGELMWMASPGGRPFDTTYAVPVITEVNGVRMFIAGGGDGAMHALKPQTGESVWSFPMSKRGVNTGVVVAGGKVIVSHGEENLDTADMGLLAAVDANAKGPVKAADLKWATKGFQGGYSSPVVRGDQILQVDSGSNLYAFDVNNGKVLWQQNLGTIQKSSPVYADGKLYVGTENGKFYILRPHNDRCEILDEDQLGTEDKPEAIIGSPAISRGRIFLVSDTATYAIGKKKNPPLPYAPPPVLKAAAGATPSHLQIIPADIAIKPGDSVQYHARVFDDKGLLIGEQQATWAVEGVKGSINAGKFTSDSANVGQAGKITATAGTLKGAATIRVIAPLPWTENFDSLTQGPPPKHWINATGKFQVREVEGNKVLVKLSDNPFTKRARAFLGLPDWKDYTVEADVNATEKRRQMGDAGVIAQRYALILFGNHQRLELQPWQPETARTVMKDFAWKPNTWYRLKLKVENLPDGKVRAQGKAWPAAEAEPADWTLERVDPIPNRNGSPGLYGDAPFEVYFDNLKVTWNR